ncbi:MAG: serine hydrolase domain-containing protein [Pseudomonadota bacterium]
MFSRVRPLALGLLLLAQGAWSAVEFDPVAVERWADEFFEPRVAAGVYNGASIGVVQDGETILLKGYGFEDQRRAIPLDPAATMIRMCSVSKTFAATALLQLRDRGLIASLDDPVNRYLKRYRLPPPHGDQVTLRQLMTHSSGMAGHFTPQGTKLDIPAPVAAGVVADLFRENIERPPGAIGQYANLGVALESVVIEDVSGQSMAAYVKEHIIAPLGMTAAFMHHATLPPPRLAQPYGRFPNGELQPVPFYPKHPLTAASGGIIAPPRDMLTYAAFLAASDAASDADDEALHHAAVLSSASRREMQRRQFGNHPADAGIGLHFYPQIWGSERYVQHGCGLPGTQSQLGVFPDSNAGLVISIIRGSINPSVLDLVGALVGVGRMVPAESAPPPPEFEQNNPYRAFLETFVGPRRSPAAPSEAVGGAVDDVVGRYWTERRSMRSFAAVFAAGSVIEIGRDAEGRLVRGDVELRRVGPGVYDLSDGRRYLFRAQAETGHVYLHTGPSSAFRKVSGLGDPGRAGQLALLGIVVSLSAFGSLLWSGVGTAKRWLRRNGLFMSALQLAIPVAAFAGYTGIADIAYIDAFNGAIGRLVFVVVLLNLFALSGLGFVLGVVPAWRAELAPGWRSLCWRCHISLLAIAAVLTWPALLLFNLLGVNT